VIKTRTWWAHAACKEDTKNEYKIPVQKPKYRYECHSGVEGVAVRIILKSISQKLKGVDYIHIA
jgi:hypothetical protein